MPNLSRDGHKLCRVKGSFCVEDRWTSRGFDVTTWAELLLLRSAWVRMSVDLAGSRVLPVTMLQVDVEGIST